MINMEKGENIPLDSLGHTNNTVFVGLNWVIKSNAEINIDASAFLVTEHNNVRSHKDFIFYNQMSDADKSIALNIEPVNESMIRAFNISLQRIPDGVKKIIFVLTIEDAEQHGHDFSMVDNINLNICDNDLIITLSDD